VADLERPILLRLRAMTLQRHGAARAPAILHAEPVSMISAVADPASRTLAGDTACSTMLRAIAPYNNADFATEDENDIDFDDDFNLGADGGND
jgi:hypothetical protein